MKYLGKPTAWAISMTLAALSCTTGCSSDSEQTASSSTTSTTSDTTPIEPETTSTVVTTTATTEEPTEASFSSLLSRTRATYDDDDMTWQYDHYDAEITLSDSGITVAGTDPDGVQVSGSQVTISQSGVYYITGTLTDGRISVTGEDKVMLYLDGVSVTSTSGVALECTNEKRTIVSLAPGSENSFTEQFSCVGDVTEDIAAIYAKDKLTINGSGSLTVCGTTGNGILCKDDLRITGGTIAVRAANHGIKGTESIAIYDGDLTIDSGKDGLKSTKSDNAEKGWIAVEGGSICIQAGGDGIQAENTLEIANGVLEITTTGAVSTSSGNGDQPGMPGGFFQGGDDGRHGGRGMDGMQPPEGMEAPDGMPPQWNGDMQPPMHDDSNLPMEPFDPDADAPAEPEENSDSDTENDLSSKGLKSGGSMTISGGSITLSTTDHAIHTADTLDITGGTLQIASSLGKGISAHGDLTISGAETAITIDTCTEGIESKAHLTISDGIIRILNATDDGINAGRAAGDAHSLQFLGGTIYVNALGDGFDSNGTVLFNGSTVIVSGPVSGGDGSFDSDGSMTYESGLILGLSANGMMELPEAGCMVATGVQAAAGDLITVTDAQGNVLVTVQTSKAVTDVIFSISGTTDYSTCRLLVGGSYEGTLHADGWATGGTLSGGTEAAWSDVSEANLQGGFGGGFGGGMHGGRRPGDSNFDAAPPMSPGDNTAGNLL